MKTCVQCYLDTILVCFYSFAVKKCAFVYVYYLIFFFMKISEGIDTVSECFTCFPNFQPFRNEKFRFPQVSGIHFEQY